MATFNNGESGLSVRTKINNVLQHTDGTASELVINDAGADVNFRVESDTNANALFLDGGTGNVGIGTTAPGNLLTLRQDTPAFEQISASESGGYKAKFGLGYSGTDTFKIDVNATGSAVRTPFKYGVGASGALTLDSTSSNATNYLVLRTNSSERMRITSTGSVGIGTTSPTNLLDVNADSIRVRTAQTPATAGAAGNQGEIAWDADYIYVCVATNTWKRVAIATW